MPLDMAKADGLLCRSNVKLDSFLKRNTERDVYERIRAYEPCVVVSESINKVFMHVVLSDDSIYLTEYPPRTVQQAVCFRDITDVELVNDFPDFLSGQERERSQHIRVVFTTTKHAGKKGLRLRGRRATNPESARAPSQKQPWTLSPSMEGIGGVLLSTLSAPPETTEWRDSSSRHGEQNINDDRSHSLRKLRSASCPNPDTLGLPLLSRPSSTDPHSIPSRSTTSSCASSPLPPPHFSSQGRSRGWRGPAGVLPDRALAPPGRRASLLGRLLKSSLMMVKREREEEEEEEEGGAEGEREAELHLYAVSLTSRIYLHLQSSWNSYIIRSTLMLDPLYKRRCSMSSSSLQKYNKIGWERTAHLFHQLSGEILKENLSLESLYVLLQELNTATHRSVTIKKLFWRSSDLCPFLVKTLAHFLHETDPGVTTTDRLLLCTLIVQTLSLMFREMEVEPARLSMLTANQGALTARLLLALVCEPDQQASDSAEMEHSTNKCTEMQILQAEYLAVAAALLFEIIVLCQEASRTPSMEHFLTVGWVLKTLKPQPSTVHFVGYQTHQVVLALSSSQATLSPSQSVLLYQRCRVLVACLQYSRILSEFIRAEFREEFRYYVKASGFVEKLPPHYPISLPAQRLLSQLHSLVLRQP
ncbi:uncharacterized protein C12orf56 homolog [Alosa pseudoharengus]|uniref:uncharacterized protein C12orf56 homolog n=1 Tax=Alosa pseudoharengus TaxID=34774 RepID=UPI003F89B5FF